LVSGASLFWNAFEILDILGLGKVIVLECIGYFGHLGSQECHCFGNKKFWTCRVSNGSLVWIALESLDILRLGRVIVLECIGDVGRFVSQDGSVLKCIGDFGHFESQERHCFGVHGRFLDIWCLNKVIVLECIGDFGHFGF